MSSGRCASARAKREKRAADRGKAACDAFATLELVDGGAGGGIPGERDARRWYLKEGTLSARSAAWAKREADEVLEAVETCLKAKDMPRERGERLAELFLSYKIGFACNREGKHFEACKALAKAALSATYSPVFFDAPKGSALETAAAAWTRKIYREWGHALAATHDAGGDRWSEVALHKLAVARGAWALWSQRPCDAYDRDLEAKPQWWPGGPGPVADAAAAVEAVLDQLKAEATTLGAAAAWAERDEDDGSWMGGAVPLAAGAEALPAAAALAKALGLNCRLVKVPPKSHVPTRCASTNATLIVEAPLVGGAHAALRVADALLAPDAVVGYDPSFEHERWHDGDEDAIFLVVEVPHPGAA